MIYKPFSHLIPIAKIQYFIAKNKFISLKINKKPPDTLERLIKHLSLLPATFNFAANIHVDLIGVRVNG